MQNLTLRVLNLEDEDIDSDLLARQLRKAGFDLVWDRARTGQQFREGLERGPDIILADYRLPDFDATEALRMLRESGRDTPFIVVSGFIGEDRAVEMIKLGAVDYILKDRLGRLETSVRAALQQKKLRDERSETELANRTAQEKIRTSELRYRRLFESAREGILIINACSGLVVDVNPFLLKLIGHSREDVVGKKPEELDAIRHVDASRAFFAALLADRHGQCEDVVLMTSAGVRVSTELVSSEYLVDDSRFVQCDVRDITERKRAMQRLRVSEERFRQLAESIPLVFFITNPDATEVHYVSAAYERMWGRSCSSLYQSPKSWFDAILGEDLPRVVASAVGLTEPVQEFRIARPDGTVRHVKSQTFPILSPDGAVVKRVGTVEDITDRIELEGRYRQSQKMEAVGRLAGGIAHDFNNLLSVILGYAGLVTEELAPGAPHREEIERIAMAGSRAAELTRQLLAFSRRQVLQPRILSLNTTIQGVEQMLRRVIGEDVVLVTTLAADLDLVKADPGQLEQVLMNLVINARDAMPRGGRLTMTTANVVIDRDSEATRAGASAGPHVKVIVTDTGSGMDAATLARAFEPYFTTKEAGKGTGLGLATVYGIVKQSNGHVEVFSTPGRGTSFEISLPRIDARPEVKVAEPAHVPRPLATETVLLVEDQDELRALITMGLKRGGYCVVEASGMDEGLAACEQQGATIDMVLTDVIMPGGSGPELARRLAVLYPDLRVLYMTGYTDDAVIHHGVLEAGIQLLEKPFTMSQLLAKVHEVLRGPTA